jgi:hypothetical protein
MVRSMATGAESATALPQEGLSRGQKGRDGGLVLGSPRGSGPEAGGAGRREAHAPGRRREPVAEAMELTEDAR